jgi:hypothetical protein
LTKKKKLKKGKAITAEFNSVMDPYQRKLAIGHINITT